MTAGPTEEDRERAADGDPGAIGRLERLPADAVLADRRVAALLAIALDDDAAALAASRVAAALAATRPSARRRSIARVRRRIRGRGHPPALLAALALIALVPLGVWRWSGRGSPAPTAAPPVIAETPRDPDPMLADGSRIVAEAGASWRAANAADGVEVHLERGRIAVHAAPQAPGRRLAVATAHARIAVVGTAFTVAAEPDATEVAVARGTVEVTAANGERLRIGAGQVATARQGAWPALLPLSLAREPEVVRNFAPIDGKPPPYWHTTVGPCPPGRPGDALHAIDYSELFPSFGLAYDNFDDPRDVIRMAAGMRFQGWLWCDGPLTGLKVQTWDADRDLDFWLDIVVPRRVWIRFDVPLSLLADHDGRHPEAGNRIGDLHLYATRAGGQTIVLDQARLVVPRPTPP